MTDTTREDELLRIILEQDDQRKLDVAELAALRDQAESREEDVVSLNETVSRLDTELATLRKALDDRRTVEGWVRGLRSPCCARVLSVTDFGPNNEGHQFELKLTGDDDALDEYEEFFQCFADSLDEAFSAAAEWVRNNS